MLINPIKLCTLLTLITFPSWDIDNFACVTLTFATVYHTPTPQVFSSKLSVKLCVFCLPFGYTSQNCTTGKCVIVIIVDVSSYCLLPYDVRDLQSYLALHLPLFFFLASSPPFQLAQDTVSDPGVCVADIKAKLYLYFVLRH